MTLTLVLEHAPTPQAETRRRLEAGELSIGRDATADWQIDDPDRFVSRQHCMIHGEGGRFTATDTSSGGLFVDGADRPLGAGNSVTLEDGMRLRLGDYVVRVDLGAQSRPEPGPPRAKGAFEFDFGEAPPYEPPPERPADLPPRFRGAMRSGDFTEPAPEEKGPGFRFDDPFTLDPAAPRRSAPTAEPPAPAGGYFDTRPEPARPEPAHRTEPHATEGLDWGIGARDTQPDHSAAPAAPPPVSDDALRAAFFRGLGIAPPPGCTDPEAEMEALGARFRALTEGLMQLLRARSQEKQNVRVAQTVIGAADVNPLKFLATPREGVEALVTGRGQGYLRPDAAIAASYRDLADHQMRTWIAVQAALRQMIDRFDPARIEKELEDEGLLQTLLAGGRGAKLWQLYQDHYAEIAKAAEDRFLGEVGADFREAYEQGKGR
ncbi:type VI secretion system-associated FHA domain protein TagH [Rhodovulum euryhalinum]|uniref:FHA domain protein n=1 Tax=Rhodovulum euryhalinum TaxID=35805 RepID=A0A4R2KKH3_9RHOB|nr:type VI secretion system-associated FHA domain protein TagH [Rhodovulum euryhalinum]TCO70528.1 FHA domain protein [Rhodovulum euryhalinum]